MVNITTRVSHIKNTCMIYRFKTKKGRGLCKIILLGTNQITNNFELDTNLGLNKK